ncbi:MAG: BMC domain-containing protein [Synergistaceae bacterium]|jgi:ethanolamine utilization protein EutS|nr:BMC domain-containing protein [Synergistaceae bacterium]
MADLASPQEKKQRVIQEYVPGKQITLAHLIANPVPELSKKLGLVNDGEVKALGILTITPSEASVIAADIATKSACVRIAFVDRFSGTLMIEGDVAAVEAALRSVLDLLAGKMQFTPTAITRS